MTERVFQVAFGPVVARIVAHGALTSTLGVLEHWLSAGICGSDRTAHVTFEFTSGPSLDGATPGRTALVGEGSLDPERLRLWDGRAWEASVDPSVGDIAPQRWSYRPRNGPMLRLAERIPTTVFRFLHVHYFSRDEVRASTFLYRHLIPIVQVHLLQHGATFVHASALCRRDGGGLLLCGWGGAGKTSGSTFLYLTRPEVWRFMSDDLAIVDMEGTVHFCPLSLNIFPYNTEEFARLHERVVAPLRGLDKLQWNVRRRLLGKKGVARRIPALPEPSANPSCGIKLCLQLERSSHPHPKVGKCTPTKLARISKNVLLYELHQALPMFTTANAFVGDSEPPLPSPDALSQAAERVLTQAMRHSRTLALNVPEAFGPQALGQVVEELWEGEALHEGHSGSS